MKVTLNINDKVRFKMLRRGWEAWNRYYTKLNLPVTELPVDEDGWSELPLWELMLVVGPACYMGPEPPFETSIEFEVKRR